MRLACSAGEPDFAEGLRRGVVKPAEWDRLADLTARATISEARDDHAAAIAEYESAASGWEELGCVLEHGLALLGGGRCLAATGRADEAVGLLEEAREIAARLGALPLVATVDDALGTERSASAG